MAMAKLKSTAKAKPAAKPAEAASRTIMDSAQQIWHAGMGAFNRAQEEGTKLFETLVKEGSTLEQKTRRMATGKVDAVRDAVENRVGAVKERAADTWDRLEKVFEDRVQRALTRLGVPGREDLQSLIQRVDSLNAELRKLGGKPAAAQPKATSKPARKAPAKPARPAGKGAPRRAAKDLTE
jgi:poly(hydroxyalkanoate) granule-associated protein